MIAFDVGAQRFTFRAAAVIFDGTRVLLHRAENDAFWSLPGGRVEGGEVAATTVVREMQEELSESVSCGELLWVVENFFSYGGKPYQELGLYFRVHLAAPSRLLSTPGPYTDIESTGRLI